MSLWLRIGGFAATEIAAHSAPSWETLADGGCGEASWAFALTARSQHQVLRAGSLVEIMAGPVPVYMGVLTEPDRTTWECHATGLSTPLRKRLALDGVGNSTRNLGTAISRVIGAGWPGSNPIPVDGFAAGDTDGNPVMVGTLLDEYAEQTGQRWGVENFGRVYMRPDPTSPTWLASPDAAVFGVTNEDVPTLLAGRYDVGDGTFATAFAGSGGVEETVDLTERGAMSGVAATAVLTGLLTRTGDTQWTNGTTLHREQLTTAGGVPANLLTVRAGQMIRAHGLSYGIIMGTPWLDVVIGKTRYTAGEDVVYLEPVNTAPRNLRDVIAAA